MFFTDEQKKIYRPDWCKDVGLDPLRVENLLVVHSQGQFYAWLSDREASLIPAGDPNEGDVSAEGKRQKLVLAAIAEIELAAVARKVLNRGEETLSDADALERLFEFLVYLKKKESPVKTWQEPDANSRLVSPVKTTPSS